MSMEQIDELGRSREAKIKALGFLCYNLYVDGVISFPEMDGEIEAIKEEAKRLSSADASGDAGGGAEPSARETVLNEKLIELGCLCYNLYVDSRLVNNRILSLCDSISDINKKITESESGAEPDFYAGGERRSGDSAPEWVLAENRELKIICPDGMEPIPFDYKRCACGYRNRGGARYCAKCGAKLHM